MTAISPRFSARSARQTGVLSRFIAAGLAVGISLGTLTACGSKDEPQVAATSTTTVTPDATASKSAVPEPEVQTTWPLTGVASDNLKDRPAVAVKIENTNAARPQYGIDKADVVWETIVEFDVSRFVAVFHSKYPEEVGPVRSVRPMDVRIVSPLKGVFIYSGGQKGILNLVRKDDNIQAFDETSGQSAMWRTTARFAPHNLNGDVSKFAKLGSGDNTSSPSEQFAFASSVEESSAVVDGRDVTSLELSLSTAAHPQWTWDKKEKAWLRSEGAAPAYVASGARISATNVVVIKAKHFDSGFNAQNKAPVPDYDLTGTGTAVVASGGKFIKATWNKKDNASPMVLLDEQGESVTLAPGNTWVELMPKATGQLTTK